MTGMFNNLKYDVIQHKYFFMLFLCISHWILLDLPAAFKDVLLLGTDIVFVQDLW